MSEATAQLSVDHFRDLSYFATPASQAERGKFNFPTDWNHYEAILSPEADKTTGKYSIQISAERPGGSRVTVTITEPLFWATGPFLDQDLPDIKNFTADQIKETYQNAGLDQLTESAKKLAQALTIERLWLVLARSDRLNHIDPLMKKLIPDNLILALSTEGLTLTPNGIIEKINDFLYGNPKYNFRGYHFGATNDGTLPTQPRWHDYWVIKNVVSKLTETVNLADEQGSLGTLNWDAIQGICDRMFMPAMEMAPKDIQIALMKPILEKLDAYREDYPQITAGSKEFASYL